MIFIDLNFFSVEYPKITAYQYPEDSLFHLLDLVVTKGEGNHVIHSSPSLSHCPLKSLCKQNSDPKQRSGRPTACLLDMPTVPGSGLMWLRLNIQVRNQSSLYGLNVQSRSVWQCFSVRPLCFCNAFQDCAHFFLNCACFSICIDFNPEIF